MGTAQKQLDKMADVDFQGAVGKKIAQYAKDGQTLCRDLAAEFDQAARDAQSAMRKLKGHPALVGVDVWARSRWVARRLRRASELARSASAEMVKFNQQYRREFLDIQDAGTKSQQRKNWSGDRVVDL